MLQSMRGARVRLPHFDHPLLIQSITFRQADSVPPSLMTRWEHMRRIALQDPLQRHQVISLSRAIEKFADAGHGSCVLRTPEVAAMIVELLQHEDGRAYRLIEWCVMPNHVHALVAVLGRTSLKRIVQAWKSLSARRANQVLGRSGPLWMKNYFDRFIRDDAHLAAASRYIRENPVRAGLVSTPEEWRWSSAFGHRPRNVQRADEPPVNGR